MAAITKFSRNTVLPYSNENAVASFYQWLRGIFEHSDGYTVVLDKELTSPEMRQELPFPCIVVNQIDTTDPSKGFLSPDKDQNSLLFYIYCMVNKADVNFGTTRLLRRMKDQVVFSLKKAGVFDDALGDVIVPPIALYDFSKSPKVDLSSTLTLSGGIMQHFSEDGEILEYELMVSFTYLENSNT